MKVSNVSTAACAVIAIVALAGCGAKPNNVPAAAKPAPPSAAVLRQRQVAADAEFQKVMSQPAGHPPTDNPAAVAAFQNAMRGAYGAQTGVH